MCIYRPDHQAWENSKYSGFLFLRIQKTIYHEQLTNKTPRKKIVWRNGKHDFNAQQGCKECKGNIKERKVRNLKSDVSRHWSFCRVSGGWNIWELEFYQPHMFRRKNVEPILTSPCKPVMLIMLHLRLLDESGFYKMAPQR